MQQASIPISAPVHWSAKIVSMKFCWSLIYEKFCPSNIWHYTYSLYIGQNNHSLGIQKCSQLHHQRFNKLSVNDGYHDGAEIKWLHAFPDCSNYTCYPLPGVVFDQPTAVDVGGGEYHCDQAPTLPLAIGCWSLNNTCLVKWIFVETWDNGCVFCCLCTDTLDGLRCWGCGFCSHEFMVRVSISEYTPG